MRAALRTRVRVGLRRRRAMRMSEDTTIQMVKNECALRQSPAHSTARILRMPTGTFGRSARERAPGDASTSWVQTAGANAAAHTHPIPTATHSPTTIAARARGCMGSAALAGGSAGACADATAGLSARNSPAPAPATATAARPGSLHPGGARSGGDRARRCTYTLLVRVTGLHWANTGQYVTVRTAENCMHG